MAVKRKRPTAKRNYSTFEKILEKGAKQGYVPAKSKVGRDWFRDIAKSTRISANKLMRTATAKLQWKSSQHVSSKMASTPNNLNCKSPHRKNVEQRPT